MLAIRQRCTNAIELVRGPYHKRGPAYIRIESRRVVETLSVDAARAGADIADAFRLVVAAGSFQLELPAESRLEHLGIFSSRVLWDGTKAVLGQRTLPISVPASATVRITIGSSRWVIALTHERPEIVAAAHPFSFRAAFRKFLDLVQAVGVHGLFLLVAAVAGNVLNVPWLQIKEEVAEIEPVPVQLIPPVLPMINTDADFSGRGLVTTPPPDAAAVAEKKARKINDGLSSLVNKMARLSFGNLGKTAQNKDGSASNAMLDALRGRIGQVRRADLRGDFKILGQGTGRNLNWDLFGSSGSDVSSKDLERVAEAFRSLQDSFRSCYESALLKFDALSVVVQYESDVTADGRLGIPAYSLTGKSDAESESMLKGCLTRVLKQVSLGKGLSGAKIRNQFIFRS